MHQSLYVHLLPEKEKFSCSHVFGNKFFIDYNAKKSQFFKTKTNF